MASGKTVFFFSVPLVPSLLWVPVAVLALLAGGLRNPSNLSPKNYGPRQALDHPDMQLSSLTPHLQLNFCGGLDMAFAMDTGDMYWEVSVQTI